MLAVTSYKKDYVAACRAGAEAQIRAYRKLAKKAPAEAAAFGPEYFAAMVLALDNHFLHRQRSFEGKEGLPLNELRMLCDSIKEHDGVMASNSTIKYDAKNSATGIAVGAKIALDDAQFEALAEAVFGDIARRYP